MLKRYAFTLLYMLSFGASAEVLTIENRSHTVDGVTSSFVLEVDVEDVKSAPKINPAEDELPLSLKRAIDVALERYRENYKSDPQGIASVSLTSFPTWDYKNRWYYKVEIIGNPQVSVVVLFNEKVVFPRKK